MIKLVVKQCCATVAIALPVMIHTLCGQSNNLVQLTRLTDTPLQLGNVLTLCGLGQTGNGLACPGPQEDQDMQRICEC